LIFRAAARCGVIPARARWLNRNKKREKEREREGGREGKKERKKKTPNGLRSVAAVLRASHVRHGTFAVYICVKKKKKKKKRNRIYPSPSR